MEKSAGKRVVRTDLGYWYENVRNVRPYFRFWIGVGRFRFGFLTCAGGGGHPRFLDGDRGQRGL